MKANKKIVLYNGVFPVWLLFLLPVAWLMVLPANLIIDTLVVFISLTILRVHNKKKIVKAVIWKVWALGFGADIIGALFMLLAMVIPIFMEPTVPFWIWWRNAMYEPLFLNPFHSIYALLWVTVSVAVSGYFIYLFNYKLFSKRTELNGSQKKKVSITLAVVTAPYLFYLPTEWFIHTVQ